MGKEQGQLGLNIEDFTSVDNRSGWCTSAATELRPDLTDTSKGKAFLNRHWSTIARIISLISVIILWCIILIVLHGENRVIGYYMVFLATVVTFFETMFILHRLFCSVERKETCLHKLWDFLLSVNTWKKLLLYVLLSIPAFVNPKGSSVTLGCGILINLIGIIDFIHLFRQKNEKKPIRYKQLGIY